MLYSGGVTEIMADKLLLEGEKEKRQMTTDERKKDKAVIINYFRNLMNYS